MASSTPILPALVGLEYAAEPFATAADSNTRRRLPGHQTHRRRSTLFSTGRNPRVQKRVQSNGSRSASSSALHQFSHWSYTPPTSVSHQFHQHRTRPPVPLFSSPNTPENHHQNMNHRRNLSTSNIKGKALSHLSSILIEQKLKPIHILDMENMFDLSPVGFGLGADDDLGLFNSEFTYFTSINSGGHEPGTVSPQELTFDHTSAPPSTTLTNFSTPSVFDTPDQTSSYETSPLFGPENSFGEESWPPLFPVQNDSSADDLKKLATISSMPKSSTAPVMMRKRSSPGQSPASTGGRHSSITGVNSRRRDKPLPPIRYDKGDPVALKRARNTEAARKSRARKVEKFEEMSKKIEDLEAEVDHWKSLYLNIQNGDTSALG
ncbi:MAG: hypothetical protein M1834_008137 [Cirrosporium novae-zelandiae]|nr:MAG: hypothetical protein M1834_008137 [Cirrosporium novae-zelandiae]